MATAKDRITPISRVKPAPEVSVPSMVVKVAAPKIDLGMPNILVDSKEFGRALDTLSQHVAQLTQALSEAATRAEQRTEKMMQEHRSMAEKMAKMKPVVNIPARPTSFYVELEKEDGDTVGMRIEAGSEGSTMDSPED